MLDMSSDVWMYSRSTRQWLWLHGPNSGLEQPVWGQRGIEGETSTPGNRQDGAGAVDPATGDLYIASGLSNNNADIRSDIWSFSPNRLTWTWRAGSSTSNVQGNFAVGIGNTMPGSERGPGSRFRHVWSVKRYENDNESLLEAHSR
jgi:hypothetical protein